ncbi:MAG TPA: hypothetical protein VFH48_00560 [Chloroflexota bacterium]|nr:hypothetical protein [Chloroflexota bacterium]
MPRVFYRLAKNNPPTTQDVLSQAALRKPPPRMDADFLRKWEGLSVFDSLADVQRLGQQRRWRIGEYIATLLISDDAPYLLRCVTDVIHGPSSVR